MIIENTSPQQNTEDDTFRKLKRISYEEIHAIVQDLPDEILHDDFAIIEFFKPYDWTVEEYTIEWNKRSPDIWKDE